MKAFLQINYNTIFRQKIPHAPDIHWYANFYFTQREAKEYERSCLDQENNTSDILFSSLMENNLEDMSHRSKPTTIEKALHHKREAAPLLRESEGI